MPRTLLAQNWITEILPVGSKRLLYEAGQLAAGAGTDFILEASAGVDVHCSAGPATSILVATAGKQANDLSEITALDVFYLGMLHI